MQLVYITVKNFRSITKANKVPLSDFTVLLGPNNEGKSNVLAAIVLALALLSRGRYAYRRQFLRYRYDDLDNYYWKRDFPVALQESKPMGRSEVTLEFCLDDKEKRRFRTKTSINLHANLRLKIEFGVDEAKLDLLLSGPIKKRLNQKSINSIAEFVAESIYIQYIPAVRTTELTLGVINELLSDRLRLLELDPKYKAHINAIEKLQSPVLDALSKELTETVRGFIPDVTKISVRTERSLARAISRSPEIDVDDGTLTSLQLKGDGIKSLAAISLMRHLGRVGLKSRSMILAVEEPESHLHPLAVHRLREVLREASNDCQVVLTTHSAALVDRSKFNHNILVQSGSAGPARNLDAVRRSLGVRQADNLSSASLVLLCEGDNDVKLLKTWLSEIDQGISKCVADGTLGFDSLGGATNLAYKLRTHKANIADVHVFVDSDEAGRKAVSDAISSSALLLSEYTACVCPGLVGTELEDLIDESVCCTSLNQEMGTSITVQELRRLRGAWSTKMSLLLQQSGKFWDGNVERRLKAVVCDAAASMGLRSLSSRRRQPFDALVDALRGRLAALMQ